jgi:hypothetical protein
MGLLARPLTKRIVGRQLAALKRIAEEDVKVRACKA